MGRTLFEPLKGAPLLQIQPRPGLHFDVINLAQEVNVPSLLPAAFYSYLMDYDIGEVLGGITREDLSVAKLSDKYREVCMRGWHDLIVRQQEQTFIWLNLIQPQRNICCDPKKEHIFYTEWYPSPKCIALACWDRTWEVGLCSRCKVNCQISHKDGRTKIWNELPSVFGLQGWDELLKV